jgi:nitroreductase
MELQQAIANRRSVKKFKRDMHIDDALLYQAIEKAADAPNHGSLLISPNLSFGTCTTLHGSLIP